MSRNCSSNVRKSISHDCYIAGKLEYHQHGRIYLHRKLIPALRYAGIEVIELLALDAPGASQRAGKRLSKADEVRAWEAFNTEMSNHTRVGIDRADMVVAVLDGDGPYEFSTIKQIEYAAAAKKLVLGFWNDVRRDVYCEKFPTNPYAELLIRRSGGTINQSLAALTETLTRKSEHRRLQTATVNDAAIGLNAVPDHDRLN